LFPHRNIHKYICTSPDAKTHNQTDRILIDRRHSSILDVRFFKEIDCGAYHYLAVAKVREMLAVNKQAAWKFDVEKFNIRKLSELEITKEYHIKI
jgi:hypothetical protein